MGFLHSKIKYLLITADLSSFPILSRAEGILYGKDIKDQASKFFKEIGITG